MRSEKLCWKPTAYLKSKHQGAIMLKIDELKLQILHGDLSGYTIAEFIKALSRYNKEKRCRYAYTVAAEIAKRHQNYALAAAMLQTALNEYAETAIDRMRCYWHLAHILDVQENYQAAHKTYLSAFSELSEEDWNDYECSLGNELMRTELHRNNFTYTPDLAHYYSLATRERTFDYYLPRKAFYRSLAEIVIYAKEGNNVLLKSAIINAAGALMGSKQSENLHEIVSRRAMPQKFEISPSANQFLDECTATYNDILFVDDN